jgi:hypothetical protein
MARGSKYVHTSIYCAGNGGLWAYRRPLLLSPFWLAPNAFTRMVSERHMAADDHVRHAVGWTGSLVEGNYAAT